MSDQVFRLPDVGEGLTEAEIVQWLVQPGDVVSVNDPVVEVETAKAVVELPSPFAGRVDRLHAEAGDLIPVGEPLLTIAAGDEASGPVLIGYGTSPSPARRRRLSAPPLRGVARAMAASMTESARVPQVTEWLDVDVSATVALQAALRADPQFADSRVTPLTIAAAAMARAVAAAPDVNAAWVEDRIEPREEINLGIAVASERGLVVPVVRDITRLDYAGLAAAITDVTERARTGALTPADSLGGTIAITNIGVFGIDGGSPLLPPGQTAILALGRILDRPWVVDGSVVPRPIMHLSLTFDHRVVDGAAGSAVLAGIAAFLQDPPERIPLHD